MLLNTEVNRLKEREQTWYRSEKSSIMFIRRQFLLLMNKKRMTFQLTRLLTKLKVKGEFINMARAWDKENI